MQKPNNYDNTQVAGEFTPISAGGHHLIIKKVEETKSSTGKPMIIVAFDTAAGDIQPGYFSKQFSEDIRPDKKWPRTGRQYIVSEDNNGSCSKNFKSFITSVEKSNNGFVTQWGDTFADQFKNKRIGGVFGIVENEYQGKISKRTELRWFCADDKVETANIPDPKLLPNDNVTSSATIKDFVNVPENAEEEIPF